MSIPAFFSEGGEALFAGAAQMVAAIASESVILDVTIPTQDEPNWCWAAVTVGIKDAYGDNTSDQCTLASATLSLKCCPKNSNNACNTTHKLEQPLGSNLESFGDSTSFKTRKFVRDNIRTDGRPIAVRLKAPNTTAGHFVVIHGYRSIGSKFFLQIQDPLFGSSEYAIEEFFDNYLQALSWDISYRTRGVNRSRVPTQ